MSLDSIDVDGLERKDRAELATIAEALGGKPTSRTKKADIIGMILDLAGVTSAGPDAAPDAPAAPARNGRNGAAGADTEAAPTEADAEVSDGGQG
ncbi:MAG TPA: Rho termination factor N-terminal domain-containing protein, partial [Microthrixaceae bacterium]|nr:Rho termination factor N-terminal domain-containing protein [Microthrixaceae bacterium]